MGSIISSITITETTRLLSTCLQREYPTVPNTPCSWLATVRFVERLPGGSLPTARVGFGNDVQMHVNIRVDWSWRIFSLVAVDVKNVKSLLAYIAYFFVKHLWDTSSQLESFIELLYNKYIEQKHHFHITSIHILLSCRHSPWYLWKEQQYLQQKYLHFLDIESEAKTASKLDVGRCWITLPTLLQMYGIFTYMKTINLAPKYPGKNIPVPWFVASGLDDNLDIYKIT